MIKYFPFSSTFDLKMGTSLMKEEDAIVEVDQHYYSEIKLKRSLLADDHSYYFNSLPGTELAQWEVVEKVVNDLVKLDSTSFALTKNGLNVEFRNALLKEEFTCTLGDERSIPLAPMDWIGRQIQEDLVLLNPLGEVVAGQLCFPSGWALSEKLGKQFIDVHAPLPSLSSPMILAANKLIERLPLGKPVARNNWGFRLDDQLDLSSKHSAAYREKLLTVIPTLSLEEFGKRIFLRVEHQTLTRLPQSGFVLFTIHTYNSPLAEECKSVERTQTMLSFLSSAPREIIEYKVMERIYDTLIHYLSLKIS
jgi:dimethylamine monooxygenase subunit A